MKDTDISAALSEAAKAKRISVADRLHQLTIKLSLRHLEPLSSLREYKEDSTIEFKVHLLKKQDDVVSFRRLNKKLYIHSITDKAIILSDSSTDCPYFVIPIVDYGIKYGLIKVLI